MADNSTLIRPKLGLETITIIGLHLAFMRVARSEPVPVLPVTGDLTLDEGPAAAPPAN